MLNDEDVCFLFFTQKAYFKDSKSAFDWLEANLAKDKSSGLKKTHTIGKRSFHYVGLGQVKHSTPESSAIDRMHAVHYMQYLDDHHVRVGAHTHVCPKCMGAAPP